MSRSAGTAGVLVVLGLSLAFAAMNGNQRVTVSLGLFTFYRVPLSVIVFFALVAGMFVMLAVGIQSDLRVRRILRERLEEEDREERGRIDRAQRDLFMQDPD